MNQRKNTAINDHKYAIEKAGGFFQRTEAIAVAQYFDTQKNLNKMSM